MNNYEFRTKKVRLKSFPYKITIDPSNSCNLRCPACHTGIKHSEMLRPSTLKFNDYKKIFDQLKEYVFSVALYNWGEPLLNKEIFSIVNYTTQNGVGSTLHSNFNLLDEEMAEELVTSGLTHIYLSIDGSTQEVYQKYRVKGDLEVVLRNIQLLNSAKKKHKSVFPFVTWKFLSFPHNIHQVNEAEKLAKRFDVDNFEVFKANTVLTDIYDEANRYKTEASNMTQEPSYCKSLWQSLYISPKGQVFPCSLAFRETERFGNIFETPLTEIWNNTSYINARKLFTTEVLKSDVPMPCRGCKYYAMHQGH